MLEATAGKYDEVVCCGDLVGYGPWPGEVASWTRENSRATVRGNHDKVASGLASPEDYNDIAQISLGWTAAMLPEAEKAYLRELPAGPLEHQHFWLLHGSPADEDQYLVTLDDADTVVRELPGRLSFFGHTHRQGGFRFLDRRVTSLPQVPRKAEELTLELDDRAWYLINPGSVGQPRDLDPRAAAAIYDSELQRIEYLRVAYPIEEVETAIAKAGLPDLLGRRLYFGK